jgi:biotin transporter BioY
MAQGACGNLGSSQRTRPQARSTPKEKNRMKELVVTILAGSMLFAAIGLLVLAVFWNLKS